MLTFKIVCDICGPGGHNISGDLPQKIQLQTPFKTGGRNRTVWGKNKFVGALMTFQVE